MGLLPHGFMTCNKKSSPLDDGRTFRGFGELIPGLKLTDGTQNIPLGARATCAEWSKSELTSTERTRALQPDCQIRLGSLLSSLEFSMRRHVAGRSDSQKPPSVLRCPSLFPHITCCITASSQHGPYTRRTKKKGIVVLYLQWIIWNRRWKGFF